MLYKTHLATSLALALPIMATTNTLSIGSIAALSLGLAFPDIDEPYSYIGCRTRKISNILNKIWGYKGIAHSLFGLILVSLTLGLMINIIHFNAVVGSYFILGYALHLVQDSFSKVGIRWFWPFSDYKFHSGKEIVYYTTGGKIEKLILIVSILILLLEIKMYYL